MHRLLVGFFCAVTWFIFPEVGWGCGSCRGPAGPGATLTAPWETWGLALAQTNRWIHGAWNERSRYVSNGEGGHAMYDLTLGVGVRPYRRLEIAAAVPYGVESVSTPGFSSKRNAWGDAMLRAKWDLIAEPVEWGESSWPPSVGISWSVRMPTGTVDRSAGSAAGLASGSIGSTATSQGLGAWETSLAFDVRRTFVRVLQLALVGEGAYRFADRSIGLDRQLGPRLLGRVVFLYLPSTLKNAYTLGLFTDFGWEGDIAYNGITSPRTGQRLWSVGAMAGIKLLEVGLRGGLSFGFNPPVGTVGLNSLGGTTLGLFVGYAH